MEWEERGMIEFSGDGPCLVDMESPVGTLTFSYMPGRVPPFRIYGPDGMEVDPAFIIQPEDGNSGCIAFDLRHFEVVCAVGRLVGKNEPPCQEEARHVVMCEHDTNAPPIHFCTTHIMELAAAHQVRPREDLN